MPNSAPGKLTRQQLYDRIRESSKDEYILSEMIRLGYWDESQDKPRLSSDLIREKGQLQRELRELLAQQSLYSDPEKALNEMHKARKKDALLRREQTKQSQSEARYQRALNWHNKNQQEITYLGDGFSQGLKGQVTDKEKLQKQNLPVIEDHLSLAQAMGVSLNELRFMAFGRKTSSVNHYQQFLIPKKTGGTRKISAPMPRLKRLQYWVLDNILEKPPLHDAAHGFVRNRSIVSNATPHVGQDVVVNMDLKDFFPSIDYKRIKGLFGKLGYSESVATVLAMLCSEPDRDSIEIDNETFHVARTPRHLPQGAPTSPAISNLICRSLDRRIHGIAKKLDMNYTRYADDLSFSCSQQSAHNLQKLFWRLQHIINDEGFVIHPDKTRIMRSNSRQEVTGIVVNEKLSIDRKTLKRFRALLFQIEKDGPTDKSWGDGALFPSIEGYANFVAMVKPEQGLELQRRVMGIKQQYGLQVNHRKVMTLNAKVMRLKAAKGEPPRDNWWQAKTPAMPIREAVDTGQEANSSFKNASQRHSETPEPAQSSRSNEQDLATKIGIAMIFIVAIIMALFIFSQ